MHWPTLECESALKKNQSKVHLRLRLISSETSTGLHIFLHEFAAKARYMKSTCSQYPDIRFLLVFLLRWQQGNSTKWTEVTSPIDFFFLLQLHSLYVCWYFSFSIHHQTIVGIILLAHKSGCPLNNLKKIILPFSYIMSATCCLKSVFSSLKYRLQTFKPNISIRIRLIYFDTCFYGLIVSFIQNLTQTFSIPKSLFFALQYFQSDQYRRLAYRNSSCNETRLNRHSKQTSTYSLCIMYTGGHLKRTIKPCKCHYCSDLVTILIGMV